MKKYNFDEIIDRENTNSLKYDALEMFFGSADVLPLWVADMDFRTPDFIVDALKDRLQHEVFGYTFRPDSYYQAIINWMKLRHEWEVKREWISFSPGVVAGLTFGIEAFSKPGDSVVVQPPVYFPFFDSVKGTKRKMIANPLKIENGRYTFDLEDLKAKITPTTKLLLLSNPQNPGGMVYRRDELEALCEICLENKIMIISDEIHSDLIYKGHLHIPLAKISEEVAQNCMVLMAPSKTFNVAGFASSVVFIPNKRSLARYERAIGVGHLHMGNIFGSIALETAYSKGHDWLDQLLEYLWDNYLYLEEFISQKLPRVKIMKPESTYLIWLDFRDYGMNNQELSEFATKKAKVALNDGGRFGQGGDGWLRINIGCPKSTLKEALDRLAEAFGE